MSSISQRYYVQAQAHQKNPDGPFWMTLVPEDRTVPVRYEVWVSAENAKKPYPSGTVFSHFSVSPYSIKDASGVWNPAAPRPGEDSAGNAVEYHYIHLHWPSAKISRPTAEADLDDGYEKRMAAFLAEDEDDS
jgi:hypothetical protein